MCGKLKQVQCSYTLIQPNGATNYLCEWFYISDVGKLSARVEKRWQVVRDDNTLRIENFKVLQVRDNVHTDKYQIGA